MVLKAARPRLIRVRKICVLDSLGFILQLLYESKVALNTESALSRALSDHLSLLVDPVELGRLVAGKLLRLEPKINLLAS